MVNKSKASKFMPVSICARVQIHILDKDVPLNSDIFPLLDSFDNVESAIQYYRNMYITIRGDYANKIKLAIRQSFNDCGLFLEV